MNISPQGQQPSAISVNMAPDTPEDAAAAAQNLADMQELWTAWHCFGQRKLKGEQVGQAARSGSPCWSFKLTGQGQWHMCSNQGVEVATRQARACAVPSQAG